MAYNAISDKNIAIAVCIYDDVLQLNLLFKLNGFFSLILFFFLLESTKEKKS